MGHFSLIASSFQDETRELTVFSYSYSAVGGTRTRTRSSLPFEYEYEYRFTEYEYDFEALQTGDQREVSKNGTLLADSQCLLVPYLCGAEAPCQLDWHEPTVLKVRMTPFN